MQDYFSRLFDYDRHANLLMTEALIAAGEPEQAVGLMAHLLMAQEVWFNRCKKLPSPAGVLWPDWKAGTFKPLIETRYGNWKTYLSTLEADDFSQRLQYNNLQGKPCNDLLADVLAHVINHGTHHRAQIGQHLKSARPEKLPPTDYIFYVRSLENS